VRIRRALVDELIAHAREEAPNECCGIVSARDGEAVEVHRARNLHASPLRYEVDPRDVLRIWDEIEGAGREMGAIYHSHTRSEPYPSQTDVNLAVNWPDQLQIIVGLVPDVAVRAYRIAGGEITETPLEVA
jgi:proteasome lid subunit RPN8/RPN11